MTPRFAFVPYGGSRGVGEYARCLILAEAARERWPGAAIGFVTDRGNPRFPHDPFERHGLDGSASRDIATLGRVLREMEPDVVVFDNAGRTAQLAGARASGAATVFLSSRRETLWKGFRLRRLARLDQLWLVLPPFDRDPLSASQRLKARLAWRTELRVFDTLFPPSRTERRAALRRRLGIDGAPYALFASGGGGWSEGGRPTAEIWLDAARRVHAATGARCVAVMGPLYAGAAEGGADVVTLPSLAPAELCDLAHDAELLAIGGGSLLAQALALGRPCVASPAGGPDQARRIASCSRGGLVEAAATDPEAIARAVIGLWRDPERRGALRARAAEARVANALPQALEALARLLDRRTRDVG